MQKLALFVSLAAGLAATAFAQPEVMAWGNLTGIRVDGYLFEFNSSMCVAQTGMSSLFRTGREQQDNSYARDGKIETVTVQLRSPRGLTQPEKDVQAMLDQIRITLPPQPPPRIKASQAAVLNPSASANQPSLW